MSSINKCLMCNVVPENLKELLKCDGCKGGVCRKCADLTETELRCFGLKRRTLSFYCKNCAKGISLIPDLLKQIANLQAEIAEVKSTIQSFSPNLNAETLYAEIQDRASRSKNIIVYNVKESASSNVQERIDHDTNKCKELFSLMGLDAQSFKIWRLGRTTGRDRPLKVTFSDSSYALKAVRGRRSLSVAFPHIRISADLTITQRNYIKSLHAKLEERKQNGEGNLVIKYQHGVPYIVEGNRRDTSKN